MRAEERTETKKSWIFIQGKISKDKRRKLGKFKEMIRIEGTQETPLVIKLNNLTSFFCPLEFGQHPMNILSLFTLSSFL